MSPRPPVLAVVGHVNKGKSSIVSTLAEDDSVEIARAPGTTTECRSFPMRVDGEILFVLVDTPGFEQARHVLDWMRARETSAAERPHVVEAFVREHERSGKFPEECKLLRPILDGAGILYVVDGSRPYSAVYEAEMEILRWTGRPRMALVNRIGDQDHVATWTAALDQYFRLVRTFDAHAAGFAERVRLLEALRELHEPWRPILQRAIDTLKAERVRRLRHAARLIADEIGGALTHSTEKRVSADAEASAYREALEDRYREEIRKLERRCRLAIEQLYQHHRIQREEEGLDLVDEDLFAESTWLRLGLDRQTLVTMGTIGGALAGGIIDGMTGGGSFLLGSVIGGAIGGVGGWLSNDRLASMKVGGVSLGGKRLTVGPAKNAQFPWVLLDRALMHHALVSARAHARRERAVVAAGGKEGIVARLSFEQQRRLKACFDRLGTRDAEAHEEARKEMARRIEEVFSRLPS